MRFLNSSLNLKRHGKFTKRSHNFRRRGALSSTFSSTFEAISMESAGIAAAGFSVLYSRENSIPKQPSISEGNRRGSERAWRTEGAFTLFGKIGMFGKRGEAYSEKGITSPLPHQTLFPYNTSREMGCAA